MAKFTKEIKEAEKIGKVWVKNSKGFQSQLLSIKKQNLKWEKDAMSQMQADIKKGDHLKPGALKGYKTEIENMKERLDMFFKEGERLFKKHDDWSIKEPRRSMSSISEKLKLGKPGTEAYDVVAKGVKKQLTDVANVIRATNKMWGMDLKYSLEIQRKRLKSLDKIINEGAGAQSRYMKQIRKEAVQFVGFCDKYVGELKAKYQVHGKDLQAAARGELSGTNESQLEKKFQIYESRLTDITKLEAMVEKNHRRVIKSVPKEFIDGFLASREKEVMDERKKKFKSEMIQANKLYKGLVDTYKKNGLVS